MVHFGAPLFRGVRILRNAARSNEAGSNFSRISPFLRHVLACGAACGATITFCVGLPSAESKQRSTKEFLGRFTVSDAAEKCSPSVVNITLTDSGYPHILGWRNVPYGMAVGSGFIISSDGLVVTNAHVASHRGSLTVTLSNGDKFPATLKAMDKRSDIALIQVSAQYPLTPAKMGSSNLLRAGEYVIALGSPLFLQNSVTLGIVSAIARPGSDLGLFQSGDFIQTDAAINVGNSGGPLISLDGEVIGINTFKAANSDGIGFAIPIDTAKVVIEQLNKYGKVVRPYIGMRMVNVTLDASNGSLAASDAQRQGVMVVAVASNSPAEKAGLKPRDIIVTFGGKPARSTVDIHNSLGLEVGRQIPVSVIRPSSRKPVSITIITEGEEEMDRGYPMYHPGAVSIEKIGYANGAEGAYLGYTVDEFASASKR